MRCARAAICTVSLVFVGVLAVRAQTVPTPPSRTQITVDRNGGLITVTFDVDGYVTLLFLPEDLIAGERFSGLLEHEPRAGWVPTFIEAGGQRAEIHKLFTWTVPPPDASGNVEFVLRGARQGRAEMELARAAVHLMSSAPRDEAPLGVGPHSFVIPAAGQIGAPFPIDGPFDGDGSRTSLTVHGTAATLVAETPRRAIFQLPSEHVGTSGYVFKQGDQTREGRLRVVRIQASYPRTLELNKTGLFTMTVTGLEELHDDLVIAFHSRRASFSAGHYGDPNWLYITPADVRGGVYTWTSIFAGIGYSTLPNQIDANLITPVTLEQQLTLILWDPRRRDWHRSPYDEKADDLRPFLPESRDALVSFWKAHGYLFLAYEVLTRLDPDGAAPAILESLGSMIDNNSGNSAIQFYTNRVLADPSLSYRSLLHDAIVRRIREHDPAQPYATCCPQLDGAVYALARLGDPTDVPLLEALHQRARYREATEAALMRFGVEKYIARTREELAAPLPKHFTREAAETISLALRRAEFSLRRELVPFVCLHRSTPGFSDRDAILVSPSMDASMALLAILGRNATPDDCRMPGRIVF